MATGNSEFDNLIDELDYLYSQFERYQQAIKLNSGYIQDLQNQIDYLQIGIRGYFTLLKQAKLIKKCDLMLKKNDVFIKEQERLLERINIVTEKVKSFRFR